MAAWLFIAQPFIIIFQLSQYDLNNVEWAIKHQIIIIIVNPLIFQKHGKVKMNDMSDYKLFSSMYGIQDL